MGLHTWFHKSKKLYDEELSLFEKLNKFEKEEIFLDDLELNQTWNKIYEISESNDAGFHDLIRTNKRNDDGTYTDDVIYSKDQCDKWLEDNKDLVYHIDKERLEIFWNIYPNGVIDFG